MESTYEFIVERHTIPGINLETGQIISSMTYYLFLKILRDNHYNVLYFNVHIHYILTH